jgi:hypothetical protein
MPKFRKKPVVIEAMQWTGQNTYAVTAFIEGEKPDISNPMAAEHGTPTARTSPREACAS